jgi:hypothetical protein
MPPPVARRDGRAEARAQRPPPSGTQTPSEQSRKQSPCLQLAVDEIEMEVTVEADRARQHILEFRMFPDVVAGQARADAVAQQVQARLSPTCAQT